MRNLRIASIAHAQVDLSEDVGHQSLIATYDSNRGSLLLCSGSHTLHCVPLFSKEKPWSVSIKGSSSHVGDLGEDYVVGMEFIVEQDALLIGKQGGDLLLFYLSSHEMEEVGKVEGGLISIALSPDGEAIALVTALNKMLLMTLDWEVLHEVSLIEENVKENGLVNETGRIVSEVQISWRGDGRFIATLGGDSHIHNSPQQLQIWERDSGALHATSQPFPFTGTSLSWVPSGAKIAVSCSRSSLGKLPRIVLFERNGLERGTFDVEGPLKAEAQKMSWNCNSEFLGILLRGEEWDAIQVWHCSNYHWYLKKEMRFRKGEEVGFFWHPEKAMLLLLWTVSGSVEVVNLCWDSAVFAQESVALVVDGSNVLVTPLSLAIIPPPMHLFRLKFQSPVQTLALNRIDSNACIVAAGLSDGGLSLVTLPRIDTWEQFEDTEHVVVKQVELNGVGFSLHRMRLLSWMGSNSLIGVTHLEEQQASLGNSSSFEQFRMMDGNEFSREGSCIFSDVVVEFNLPSEAVVEACDGMILSKGGLISCVKQTHLDRQQAALAIFANPIHKESLFVHVSNGALLSYDAKNGLFSLPNDIAYKDSLSSQNHPVCTYTSNKLIFPSLWVQAIVLQSSQRVVVVALDEMGRLQVGSLSVSSECTGFALHRAGNGLTEMVHLVYLTKQDTLQVVNINDDILTQCEDSKAAQQGVKKPNLVEGRGIQSVYPVWERGARLITALGGSEVAVILQTYRGNLETLYPRNLVLGSIAAALNQWEFGVAMALSRQHHINLNVLVDYRGWENFAEMAHDFVKQVGNLSHITELITSLNTDNVLDGIYKGNLLPYSKSVDSQLLKASESLTDSKHLKTNKVQGVLKALRDALEKEFPISSQRELCILTTLARSDPPELDEALKRIKKVREYELSNVLVEAFDTDNCNGKPAGTLSAEEALKHLLWLSDSDSVFNAALGLYDLHLAAMVASNSQRDPKEFLPLLHELEDMPPSYMHYKIDCKLGRFESALSNLAAAGHDHFDECMQLIKSNPELFCLGKQIFKEGSQRMVILEAWGDHLLDIEKFEDAALAFISCHQLPKAMGAYRAGGVWEKVMILAGMMEFSSEKIARLAEELKEELQALGRPGDAAQVALRYCKDAESAIRLYIEAREWIEAIQIAFSSKADQVGSLIEPAAEECASTYIVELEEGLEKVGKYLSRYLAVRQRRILLASKLKADAMGDNNDDDSVSDVSSNVSSMSAYTTGSTRASDISRRSSTTVTGRNSKKSYSGGKSRARGGRIRAGSPGEETALLDHLERMAMPKSTLAEIRKLLHVLILVGHGAMAEKLQSSVRRFQLTQQNAVTQVYEKMNEENENEASDTKKQVQSISDEVWWWEVLGTAHS